VWDKEKEAILKTKFKLDGSPRWRESAENLTLGKEGVFVRYVHIGVGKT